MSDEPDRPGWSKAQRRLHWLVAVGVALALVLALVMTTLPDGHRLAKFVLYQVHKSIGLLVFGATLVRLALRARRRRPPLPDAFSARQRRLVGAGHAALYGLLLVVPLLGYLSNSTSPSRIPVLFLVVIPLPNITGPSEWWNHWLTLAHLATALTLLALACGHAAMAIRHHRKGLGVLNSMAWR